jgi:hypothetical protein
MSANEIEGRVDAPKAGGVKMNDDNLDLSSILLAIEPGYIVVRHDDGSQQMLIVPEPMELTPGVKASVGFALDGADGVLGRPVFLHRRMNVRHLGNLDEYLEDPFVQSLLSYVAALIDRRLGVLPVISVIEALRLDLEAPVPEVVAAVLEHRNALWLAAPRG